jgi:hypothetical protein
VLASTSTPLPTPRRQPSKAQTILSPVRIERHDDWIEAFFDSIGHVQPFQQSTATSALSPKPVVGLAVAKARRSFKRWFEIMTAEA